MLMGLLWQEKAARLSPVEEIRTVLDRSLRGTLSTFSKVSVLSYPYTDLYN